MTLQKCHIKSRNVTQIDVGHSAFMLYLLQKKDLGGFQNGNSRGAEP